MARCLHHIRISYRVYFGAHFAGGCDTSGAGGEGSDGVSTTLLKEADEAEVYFDYSNMNDNVPRSVLTNKST